jgi:hypothetical protein
MLLLAAMGAPAQEVPEAPAAPALFRIERIVVEGPAEAVANIVRAETLLDEGGSYTEEELRQAINRVHRLPFVLDARFALRKGSERGSYELVVEADPARWFFFDHWVRAHTLDEPLAVDPGNLDFGDDDTFTVSTGGLVGARRFVGRSGVLFAGVDSEEALQVGFTQYDLFGRGIVASAGWSTSSCCVSEPLPFGLDPTFAVWDFSQSDRLSLNLSVPLGGRQAFQVMVSDLSGRVGIRKQILRTGDLRSGNADEGDLSYQRAQARWVYDTSDDPIVPSRGVTLSVGIEASRFEGENLSAFRLGPDLTSEREPLPPFESKRTEVAVSGTRHWSVTPRQAVSATGRVAAGRSRIENLLVQGRPLAATEFDTVAGSAGVRHALALVRSRGRGNFNDLWLETGAEFGVERTSPDLGPSPLERLSFSIALLFRNQWGRIRASLSYLDVGRVWQ